MVELVMTGLWEHEPLYEVAALDSRTRRRCPAQLVFVMWHRSMSIQMCKDSVPDFLELAGACIICARIVTAALVIVTGSKSLTANVRRVKLCAVSS